ncbi:Pentatricopeptide repeat-containing protein [Platanthera guangdongensis]|uniref:Pentatricopeptide repeat-containing protein n=1 Tax=Platanthera guangdongensis TaxID=2320717 RepID=A0ABR2MJS3_9ASPA
MHKTFKALCLSGRISEAVQLLCCGGSPVSPQTCSLVLQETIHRREFKLGNAIHAHIISTGFITGEYLATKLLILHAKAGELKSARHLFDQMPDRNLFAYNALISGCVHGAAERLALELYYLMRANGLEPDQFTFASIFRACARLTALGHGARAQCVMIKTQTAANAVVSSALVDMYFKCSSPDDARKVFDGSPERNAITWTAVISGYGWHGRVNDVIEMFHRMVGEGFWPNSATFLSILSACSHGGLVDAGWRYFNSMEEYGVSPKKEHHAMLVDMLGRAGRVKEAYEFVLSLRCGGHSVVWGALVGACRVHGDVELARVAAAKFFEMQPDNVGKYVVISNVFAASKMWERAADVWGAIRTSRMKKQAAWSSAA